MSKLYDPRLLDALEGLAIENWSHRVWRATIGAGAIRRANTYGARWNPPGLEALYTSLSKDGAIAELQHLVAGQPIEIRRELMTTALEVRLHRVVDLSTAEALEKIGYASSDVLKDDHAISQHIGGAVAKLEIPGLLVASARSKGSNLVIFMTKRGADDIVEVSA